MGELPPSEVSVIVNERGDVGIDGELLALHVRRVREITGGCVCCSSQAELMEALREMSQDPAPPRRILVETSGAASPAGVIRVVTALRARERLRLDGVVTVVDVTRAADALAFDLAIEQLGFADVVVLSHVDEVEAPQSDPDLDPVRATLQRHAPAAVFAEARHGVVDGGLLELLEARKEALLPPASPSPHTSIEAVSLEVKGELDEARFLDWVETSVADVEARILRLKGIVAVRGVAARVILQGVGTAVEVELGRVWGDAERTSRVVILGLGLDAAMLEAGFVRCAPERSL